MSLQVVGLANQGTKVVLWSEERKPVQTWNLEDSGYIVSCLFKGLCLDIKGEQLPQDFKNIFLSGQLILYININKINLQNIWFFYHFTKQEKLPVGK